MSLAAFGDQRAEDVEAAILDPSRKNLRALCMNHPGAQSKGGGGSLKEFDVRQYLFAKRALLMLKDIWHARKVAQAAEGQGGNGANSGTEEGGSDSGAGEVIDPEAVAVSAPARGGEM